MRHPRKPAVGYWPELAVAALLMIFLFSSGSHAENAAPVLVLGSETDFPPYALTDANGRASGFSVERLAAVAETMGPSIKIPPDPWHEVLVAFKNGRLDILPLGGGVIGLLILLVLGWSLSLRRQVTRRTASLVAEIDSRQATEAALQRTINELTQIQDELNQSRNRLDLAAEFGEVGIWDLDIVQDTLWRSFRHDQIFGYDFPQQEWCVKTALRHVIPEDRAKFRQSFEEAFCTGKLNLECRINHQDQSQHTIAVLGKVIYDENAKPIRALGTVEDVTERRQIEEKLRQADNRMRTFFERQIVGMAITSLQKGWLQVNDRLCEMLGYSREELDGLTWAELTYPDDLTADVEQFERILNQEIDEYTLEKRFIRKDGTIIYTDLSVGCVRNPDGSVNYFLALLIDITERKNSEAKIAVALRQLADKTQQLEMANAELKQFTYAASHDLRAPLRMVTSYLDLIVKKLGPNLDDDMRQFIGFAASGANRMAALIVGLLDYSRTGRDSSLFEPVPLEEILQISMSNLQVSIEETGAMLDIAADLPTVTGDRIELVRLFQNLIGNAIKYRIADRPAKISVGWRDDGPEWVVWVKDNGIGIDAKNFGRVFEVFQRLVSATKYEGSGIGLAICKKTAEHHGGRIWLESTPGEGSTFLVAFPKTLPD
ncbi:MAG: PAS domain S-box protein [Alphaproteobacteria bacterium]|nr:PAS domain S-box protein [Alphaproteobacteria bacterium]